ncbi:MAG: YifB family Mg chelatase-like AAA ATPase [Tissierellales bacterium]|nr:YifB family Mg chelatase-like AAA ATPase [Tissierellales bacterium]
MYSKLKTCVLQGLNGHIVEVETDLSKGLPVFNIVGLPDTAIKESKERVRSAIKNSGFEFPLNRITINLAPANLKKDGSQMDLSIAIGILAAAEVVQLMDNNLVFLGELSLDGMINPIIGALPMVISMREYGFDKFIIPYANKDECSIIDDVDIIPAVNLRQVCDFLNGNLTIESYKCKEYNVERFESELDFTDIKGQNGLKRAMQIAAAGSHNMLIVGPPGSGKTMSARRLPTILPSLSIEESIEVTKIYSIAGLLNDNRLIVQRPFRAPHHSASSVSIIGGGKIPKPGEVSLAHHGVLFFDELPEFQKNVLEVLRQPLEDGFVHISRANASLTYPSNFMFVASMNPCPCGNLGDPYHQCTCSQNSIEKYLNKISHPLLDRIDIHVDVLPVKYDDLNKDVKEISSLEIREIVEQSRQIQKRRNSSSSIVYNANLLNKDIRKICKLSKSAELLMAKAFEKYKFSARSYNKILKVARTIADLEQSEIIDDIHLSEAIRYRSLDKKYWR